MKKMTIKQNHFINNSIDICENSEISYPVNIVFGIYLPYTGIGEEMCRTPPHQRVQDRKLNQLPTRSYIVPKMLISIITGFHFLNHNNPICISKRLGPTLCDKPNQLRRKLTNLKANLWAATKPPFKLANILRKTLIQLATRQRHPCVYTTRKQRHTEGKNRRYVVGITLFRRHTDETSPRK